MTFELQAVRGVLNSYGPRVTDQSFGGHANTVDNVKTAVWQFTYNNLPDAATNQLAVSIPAGSTIVSAKFRVVTAFTSTSTTTDLTVGLQDSAGTEIDNDGLLTAVNLDQTAIALVGNLVTGTGALVGKTIGAAAGELVVAPNVDDLLTGEAQVIVEYITPAP